jgi:hypothetical protein
MAVVAVLVPAAASMGVLRPTNSRCSPHKIAGQSNPFPRRYFTSQ